MMMPQPGEIWIADVPFTSGMTSKLRPVFGTKDRRRRLRVLAQSDAEQLKRVWANEIRLRF
jgi:hypothetical protein